MTRTFKTKATRNSAEGKFAYKDFVNPLCEYSFAKYMHSKRELADGTLRDGDNWQMGIPKESLVDSFVRHSKEVELLHLGFILIQYNDDQGEHTEVFNPNDSDLSEEFMSQLKEKGLKYKSLNMVEVLNAARFNLEAYKLSELGYVKK